MLSAKGLHPANGPGLEPGALVVVRVVVLQGAAGAAAIGVEGAAVVADGRDHVMALVELGHALVALEEYQPADAALRSARIGGLAAIADRTPLDQAVRGVENLDGEPQQRLANRIAIDPLDQAVADIDVGEQAVAQRQVPRPPAGLLRAPAVHAAEEALAGGAMGDADVVVAYDILRADGRVQNDAVAEAGDHQPVGADALPRLAAGGRAEDVQSLGRVRGLAVGFHAGAQQDQIADLDVLAIQQADAVGVAGLDGRRALAVRGDRDRHHGRPGGGHQQVSHQALAAFQEDTVASAESVTRFTRPTVCHALSGAVPSLESDPAGDM